MTLAESVTMVPTAGAVLAIGGNALHRVPHAWVRALAAEGRVRAIHLVKTAGAYDIDLLALAGMLGAVSAGFVGYESEFGLARHYRRAVETGVVEAREHACYTAITALRAAAYGVSFLPVNALQGSDLVAARGFAEVTSPYGAERHVAIPAIVPDVAVIHVQFADRHGNGVILGPKNEDLLMARAAKRVILTAERIVASDELPVPMDHVDIPAPLVTAVVEAPRGAWPGSCAPDYGVDADGVRALQALTDRDALAAYLRDLQGVTA